MDGVATAAEYAERCKQINMPALAVTDHGTLSGHRAFNKAMLEAGVKPIFGIEGYIAADRFDTRARIDRTEPLDLVYNHIVLLAKDAQGLENISKLNEIAWTEGFFHKPRIDYDVLEQFGKGLIVSSACASGLLAKAVEHDQIGIAKARLQWFVDHFGEDFYVEIMPHTDPRINGTLLELAAHFGTKCITTCDCHHATLDQKAIQEVMLLLNTHAQSDLRYDSISSVKDPMQQLDMLYGDDRPLSFRSFDIHLGSRQEQEAALLRQGIDMPALFDNTLEIAEKVEALTLESGLELLPADYKDPQRRLESIAVRGLEQRGLTSKEYMERLRLELDVIEQKHFSPYFLIVQNVINNAKSNGILVGPGRGSAAGSLVCYALGITDIDPIEYGLLFFRFINPGYVEYEPIFNVL